MKKPAVLMGVALLVACGETDSLESIKKAKVNGYDVAWHEAANNFSVCETSSQQWALLQENREDRSVAIFTCTLNIDSFSAYNAELLKYDASTNPPSESPKIVSASLEININHWKTEQRKKYHAEFESSGKLHLKFNNGATKSSYLTNINEIISQNKNPIALPDKPFGV